MVLKQGMLQLAQKLWRWTPFGFAKHYRELTQRVYNRRLGAIDEITGYLLHADVPGDYCEFGVFQGNTFSYVYRRLDRLFPQMRFFAFDSFEGLPEPIGRDRIDDFTGGFRRGQYACDEATFRRNIKKKGIRESRRVVTVPGWFDKTLTEETGHRIGLEKIAFAWIDVDLYESTVPVLEFLTPRLSVGSVIVFDDWRAFRNLPDYGEQRACREWLERHPNIEIRELFSFGHIGMTFTVAKC